MKRIFTTLICLLSGLSVQAQEACSTGRYSSDVYSTVSTTSNITYGQNYSFNGSMTSLKLDFYEPQADTATKRPLIIWIHGGSFIGGSKTDQDMVALSNRFAKKGFVCASLDYRLGFFPIDSANAIKAVLRATQDARAAVRFFYKNAQNGNSYKVDTNNIFIGGASAGAITALHFAYLDKTCELTETGYMTQTALDGFGGAEGYSGNPCYSSDVKGVINLCGALARYSWMESGDVPVVSLHGTNDGTVGYNRQIVNPGVPLMYLDGSRMLYEHATAIGLENPFYTFKGAPHVPHAGTSASALAYMDTTVNFVRDFLIDQMGCTDAPLQAMNATQQTATLYTSPACTTNVVAPGCFTAGAEELMAGEVSMFPNPAKDQVTISISEGQISGVQVFDLNGRLMTSSNESGLSLNLDVSALHQGVYFIKIMAANNSNYSFRLVKD
ncbi:MAG: T9SS type A sorting domain-containing protein [Bacteroidota bacterium]